MTTFAKTKRSMESLGTYKPEFDTTIKIYIGLIKQYNALESQLKKSKYNVAEQTGYSDNSKKSPLIATMESLRKDILSYANALGLTPAAMKKIKDEKIKQVRELSELEKALMQLD